MPIYKTLYFYLREQKSVMAGVKNKTNKQKNRNNFVIISIRTASHCSKRAFYMLHAVIDCSSEELLAKRKDLLPSRGLENIGLKSKVKHV